EGKATAYYLENVEDFFASQQHDTGRIITGFRLAERDVPAHDDAITGLTVDLVIGREPFALDDGAAGWDRALLILRRKGNGAYLTLEFGQHIGRLLCRMKELALLPIIGATVTELVRFVALRDRRQVQHFEATLLL